MDVAGRIEQLETTTFCGRRFTRQQITDVATTVSSMRLSRNELAATVCENLNWRASNGKLKISSALELLEKLEKLGICRMPAARPKRTPARVSADTSAKVEPPCKSCVTEALSELTPLTLKVVSSKEERQKFKSLMAHHYLGFKHPFGASLSYFVFDRTGRELGLLQYSAASWSLMDRDEWIGWGKKDRAKRLNLVVCNSRFLIFPHVSVANLASKILSLAPKQLPGDWQERYGYCPVLIETFVDQEKYQGTCYQAANWQHVGTTKGLGRFGQGKVNRSIKDIYVYPLASNFRDVLLRKDAVAEIAPATDAQLSGLHDDILGFWCRMVPLIRQVAAEFDQTWQVKRRVINSLLLVLLVFRLIASRGKGSYASAIDGVWENCRRQRLPLPQKTPISPSSFTDARQKLDEKIFKVINSRVMQHYEKLFACDEHLFHDHRLFAVDGSLLNLPNALKAEGFNANQKNAHYPQGLLSVLYRLRLQMPVDFDLTSDGNERKAALGHFASLSNGDVVIYDRGYFSYAFLEFHIRQGIHGVFRLSRHTLKPIVAFMESGEPERVITLEITDPKSRKDILKANPEVVFRPLTIRLIKYEIDGQSYFLATTLIDGRYPKEHFTELYHERWGTEEFYKIVKKLLALETFHAKTVRGVKQEIFANLTLITLNRIFTNYTDGLPRRSTPARSAAKTTIKTNFNAAITAMSQNIERLLMAAHAMLRETAGELIGTLYRRRQAVRPNRSYPRRSLQPKSKWQTFKSRVSKAAAARIPQKPVSNEPKQSAVA
jgi:hypothetical protein